MDVKPRQSAPRTGGYKLVTVHPFPNFPAPERESGALLIVLETAEGPWHICIWILQCIQWFR